VRAFVAVEVGGRVTGDEGTARAPEHLTLRFLGDLPEEELPRVVAALEPIAARTAPFSFVVEGVGAFPSRTDPRVVWVGVTDGRERLMALAAGVTDALRPIVGDPERERFVPHLTLFRVRGPADRVRARDLLEGRTPAPARQVIEVREFLLKESELGRGGAVHRTVARFPLSAGAV
jgi:RNA 2',3'-cyclic 3'-phosphodiesterase